MQTVLIVIHLLIVVALVATVLLQRSEGGALGMGGGTGGFMTGRGQANALTRLTAILGAIFFVTSLALTLIATWGQGGGSIIDRQLPGQTQPAAPGAPQGGSVLDQLRQLEQRNAPAAPAAPTTGVPVPPAAPAAPQQ